MVWETETPWQVVATAALVGTERQPFRLPEAAGVLGNLLAQLADRPMERGLLAAAGTLALHQQAGWVPEQGAIAASPPCAQEALPCPPAPATRLLRQMLQGHYPQVLPEWLEWAAAAGQRVPSMDLPRLLERGRQQSNLRPLILPVLGQRGRWLAAQNPDWNYAVEVASAGNWETGTLAARLLFLQGLRTQQPEQARTLLAVTWGQEAASDRSRLLATLATGLSLADEPFLREIVAGDRSKEVRRVAVDLLASLPESQWCQQMVAQVQPYVFLEEPPSQADPSQADPSQADPSHTDPSQADPSHTDPGSQIIVQLPETLDPVLERVGIEPQLGSGKASQLGEKAGWLLQMIGATPLTHWSQTWGLSPGEIVALAKHHVWEAVLLDGWALAAKRQRNTEWGLALCAAWITETGSLRTATLPELTLENLLAILSPEQRNGLLVRWLRTGRFSLTDSWTLGRLRHHRPWDGNLAETVLEALETDFAQGRPPSNLDWELRSSLKDFGQAIPVAQLPQAIRLRESLPAGSPWIPYVEELLSLLQFRQEVKAAFSRASEGAMGK